MLPDSAKASAALSRRCLQNLLRQKADVKPGNLADEIQQVIDNGKLPSHLSESIDAIRNIGNFSAHPIKSKSTGEIVAVEPEEAEWNLDVLESVFDFFYVQPDILKAKREALNKKLAESGKPPIEMSSFAEGCVQLHRERLQSDLEITGIVSAFICGQSIPQPPVFC